MYSPGTFDSLALIIKPFLHEGFALQLYFQCNLYYVKLLREPEAFLEHSKTSTLELFRENS